jgi:site-specific DNA recombinase
VVKQAPTSVRLHPNLSELYRQKVADLHLALADPQIGLEALSLLRSLIERIVVRPLPAGAFELEIIGALVAMVGLGQALFPCF